jgi:hypothetical protein
MPISMSTTLHRDYSDQLLCVICRLLYAKSRMPSALFYMLYAKCYVLYANLHMLDCNMPNAMTTAMSFSMITEEVGHLIIYIH